MAASLWQYSTTPSSNNSPAPDGAPEGMSPSGVNDAMREHMARSVGALLAQTSSGTSTIALTMVPAPTAYVTGMLVNFKAGGTNTGPTTLNVNGLGAKNVFRQSGSSLVACTGGEIISGQIVTCFYDGTQFQLVTLIPGSYLIGAQTASGSATIDFTTGIDTTFDEYEFRFNNVVPATTSTNLWLRISQSATFKSGATNYAFSRNDISDAGTATASGVTAGVGGAQIPIAGALSNTAGRGVQGTVRFSRPGVSSEFKMFRFESAAFDGTNSKLFTGQGWYTVDGGAIDGVRFLMSSGNISTGNFALYGIRK